MTDPATPRVVVIGAGPAGLTAALLLTRAGATVTVLEADPESVGGISRTVRFRGCGFDIGPHRFFSKAREVEALWSNLLPRDMRTCARKSRIYYDRKYFSYPLRPLEALRTLGLREAARCVSSYARARLFPVRDPRNFEDWTVNRFGRRLFEIFFKTYTEKVWGMSCREISADWAAQRISSLSLAGAIWNAVRPGRRGGGAVAKTLIDEFRYPRLGAGQMWEACAAQIRAKGGTILMGRRATSLRRGPDGWSVAHEGAGGPPATATGDHVISSAAIRDLLPGLEPALPADVIDAARALRYRDFIVAAVVVRDRGAFDDHWIYIQDPGFRVGRVENVKAWSPDLIEDPSTNCYVLEYTCFEGDGLWTSTDGAVGELASRELAGLGLTVPADILGVRVVRQRKAYPVYDEGYAARVGRIREALRASHPGLHLVGRNGMHKYNNQDHAMMTAMLVARNILAGSEVADPWRVNQDAEYIEAGRAGAEALADAGGRLLPGRARS